MSPAILPLIGWGATAIGGASLIPPLLNHGPERRKALLRDGPDEFGDYDLQLGDRLFLEEESLPQSQKKYDRKQTLENSLVQQAQRKARRKGIELPVLPGMSAKEFLDVYDPDIQKLNDEIDIDRNTRVRESQYYGKPALEARRVAAEARNDNLLLIAQQRADQQQELLDNSDYRRSRDNKEDLRYNELMERENKKDRRAAISSSVAGLIALSAAFAA